MTTVDNPHGGKGWVFVAIYSVGLVVVWHAALGFVQSRDLSLAGIGVEEYRRVMTATAWVFGIIAAGGLLLHEQMARGYLLIALPVGLVGLIIGRYLLRRNLAKKRSRGEFTNHVVVLGKPDSIIELCNSFDRSKFAGYKVIGARVLDLDGEIGDALETSAGEVPILGDVRSVEEALRITNADALAVAAVERLGHEHIRRLAWRLDLLLVDMIVVPGMTDITGPRAAGRRRRARAVVAVAVAVAVAAPPPGVRLRAARVRPDHLERRRDVARDARLRGDSSVWAGIVVLRFDVDTADGKKSRATRILFGDEVPEDPLRRPRARLAAARDALPTAP